MVRFPVGDRIPVAYVPWFTMLDRFIVDRFTQSLSTGSGDGTDVSTIILSVRKVSENVPGPVLVNVHVLRPCEVKCSEGIAIALDADSTSTNVPKNNLFIFISPHNKEFSSLKQHYINLLRQRAMRA
jgi:hypothetical protein